MYAYLKGELAAKKADRIIVEVGGIGYNVFFPAGEIAKLPAVGSAVKIFTYTAVREDAISLYGFPDAESLDMFILLISVSGVGPKAAQSLLSEMSAFEIRLAILGADIKKLCKAQGVAKKTAERIIVDLKSRIGEIAAPEEEAFTAAEEAPLTTELTEAAEALVALGYGAKEAQLAVNKAASEGITDTEGLLKAALKYI